MKFRLLLVLVVVAASTAFAADMPVNNPSFEITSGTPVSCGGSCLRWVGAPQWSTSGAAGILQPGNGWFNYIPDGQNVAYTDPGKTENGVIYQDIGMTSPGVAYTLRVDFGWELNHQYNPYQFARLVIGGSPFLATGVAPTEGNWSTFTATYPGGPGGLPIRIDLGVSTGQGEAVFDNVRLSDSPNSPAPEPTGLILLGSGLGLVPLLRRRFFFGGTAHTSSHQHLSE